MFIRKRLALRALVPLVSSIVLAGGVTAGLIPGTASPASAITSITICLKNSTSFCADVKNSNDVSGQPIWLYKNTQANDYHWHEATHSDCYNGLSACLIFQDLQNTNLCLGASDTAHAVLLPCGYSRSQWIANGTHLHNLFWSRDLTVAGPLANGNLLFVYPSSGCSGCWQQWTGF